METDESRILACRDPRYHALSVPAGCVALTCGIDTQKRGFYYAVVGWRPDMSSHVVDYGYVENFSDIARIVFDTWYGYDVVDENSAKTGEVLPVWRACIDSGGTETDGLYSRTQEVYNSSALKSRSRAFFSPRRGPAGARPRRFAGPRLTACHARGRLSAAD